MTPDPDLAVLAFSPWALAGLNAILAILMFSVALDLMPEDFLRLRRSPRAVLAGLVAQFLVLPALTLVLVWVTAPTASVAMGLILVAACPGGNLSTYLTHRAGGDAALSATLTTLATVAALVLTPLNLAFWGGLYPPTRAGLAEIAIDPLQLALTVGLVLLVPLAGGVAVNRRRPALAAGLRPVLRPLTMAIFAGFLLVALAANWRFVTAFAGALGLLVVLHNALAFAGGALTAWIFALPETQRRAVTLETGIQNSGLGLALIFSFFHGLGGMAVIAALWGIWHAVSGFAVATYFARRGLA